jgi:hypothetical protein
VLRELRAELPGRNGQPYGADRQDAPAQDGAR